MHFDITEWIVKIPVLLFAITVHEYSHGRAAFSLGDPTAKRMGRLSFNPLTHLDPLGAVCLFLFNFGWARPVPVDSRYFKNGRKDIILMALSGPAANLSAAFLAGILIRYFLFPSALYLELLLYMVLMNLGLGIFNLIPIPPLDGSHVLKNLLPLEAAKRYQAVARYGPILIMAVVLLDNFAHTGILSRVLIGPIFYLAHLFAGDNLFGLLQMF